MQGGGESGGQDANGRERIGGRLLCASHFGRGPKCGSGRTVWYPSPRPRLSRGSSLSLGVRGGSPCSSSNESSIVAAAGAPDVWDEAPARRHF